MNFNNLDFKRVIMHTIVPKNGNTPADVIPQNMIFGLNEEAKDTLRTRLVQAAGMRGKAFKLTIEDTFENSFFDLCSKMKLCTDQEFIDLSASIAYRLAENSQHSKLPGGFLLVVHAVVEDTKKDWYIVIKADPHTALTSKEEGGKVTLEVLDKIFLSPTQKLFKIGMLEEVNLELAEVNQKYNCYLFDHQFNAMDTPAKYFYGGFLGFSIENNMQIQSKLYYNLTEEFIKKSTLLSSDDKEDALDALRLQFQDNEVYIAPEDFSNRYFNNEEVQSQYSADVADQLPSNFLKDKTLITNRISTKKIEFNANIKVIGPDDEFKRRVRILKTQEALDSIRISVEDFTVLVIDGKPYR